MPANAAVTREFVEATQNTVAFQAMGLTFLPHSSRATMNKKRVMKQSRAEQIEEAEAMHEWFVLSRDTAGVVVNRMVRQVKDRSKRDAVRMDLQRIAKTLARAHPAIGAVWRGYDRHFLNNSAQKKFFRALTALARNAASISIHVAAANAFRGEPFEQLEIEWDETVFPQDIAPEVTRLLILQPRILKQFLPAYFKKMAALAKDENYRRALAILDCVPKFGWSAAKHTQLLIEEELVKPSVHETELEMVKKSIRDLRKRYRRSGFPTRRRRPKILGDQNL